jgi:hypothetical protein
MRPYRPTLRASVIYIAVVVVALGYAFYMRYMVLQNTPLNLSCDAGANNLACLNRTVIGPLLYWQVFGWIGLGAAVLAVIRPGFVLLVIALAATALALVLYNGELAGLAAGLIILAFARPAPEPE